jgi:hypothetical protein
MPTHIWVVRGTGHRCEVCGKAQKWTGQHLGWRPIISTICSGDGRDSGRKPRVPRLGDAPTREVEIAMPTPLEKFFAAAWESFLDGACWDGPDLGDAIKAAGLGEWREATDADIGDSADYEVGDSILALTDAGKAAIKAART